MTQEGPRGAGQALARKWRPRGFDALVGQEHVVRALTNALLQNRLHHAWLLTGTRGVGKTTLARIMAKALNCETGVTPTPCGVCAACTEIDGGRFVDLLELDAASNTQVDNMRELLEGALYAPTSGRFKVYIIDEVHMLSRSAFNAMLKTLEEPPGHVKFILATTDPQKVPVTVLSRCLQFNLKQIPVADIRARLEHILGSEAVEFEAPALNLIARAAQGSLRDALSLLDQAIAHGAGKVEEQSVRGMLGTVDQSYLFSLLEALTHRDGARMLAIADEMLARSFDFEAALQDMAALLHRTALAQTLPEVLAPEDPDRAATLSLAAAMPAEDVQLYYQIALQGRADLPLAPDAYAGFTMPLLRMLAFAPQVGESGSPAGQTPQGSSTPTRSRAPAPRLAAVAPPPQSAAVASTAEKPSTASAAASPRPAPPAASPPSATPAVPTDWHKLVAGLNLGGMARMLAQHSELAREEHDQLQLTVAEGHRHLLEKPYRDKLQAALEEHYGRRIRVEFTLGNGTGDTPAERKDQERQARQQRAIEAIEADPFVRELVENFDARVADETIKPIERPASAEANQAKEQPQ